MIKEKKNFLLINHENIVILLAKKYTILQKHTHNAKKKKNKKLK